MKIKIGDKIIDAENEPVMLIFEDDAEVKHVAEHLNNMQPDSRLYCMFPEGTDLKIIHEFMKY